MTATFGNPQYYSMVSDGSGGAIVAWEGDPSPDECCAIFAQRILSGGTPAWSAGGVLLTPDPTFTAVKTVSDGAGGAIIAFANGAGIDPVPLEVQRIGPDGSIMWNSGVTVGRMVSAYNNDFDLVSDGAGGAIIAWDTTLAGFPAIEAQRLDPDGNPLWSAGGVMVVSITGNLFISDLAGDGAGGAVAIWDDSRNDPSHNSQDCANAGDVCNVYAQRLGSDGSSLWTKNGVPVVAAPNSQFRAQLTPTNDGSFLATWSDCRNAPGVSACLNNMKVYMQVLTSAGTPFGPVNGVPVSTAPWNQGTLFTEEGGWPDFARIPDGLGGALLAWPDGRNAVCEFGLYGSGCDLFVQRVGVPGTVGMPSTTPTTTPSPSPTATPTPVAAALSVRPARLNLGKGVFRGSGVAVGKPRYLTIERHEEG